MTALLTRTVELSEMLLKIIDIESDIINFQAWMNLKEENKDYQDTSSVELDILIATPSKLNLFSLYGQRFPRYEKIFKIAIFGHETQFQKLHIYSLATTRG